MSDVSVTTIWTLTYKRTGQKLDGRPIFELDWTGQFFSKTGRATKNLLIFFDAKTFVFTLFLQRFRLTVISVHHFERRYLFFIQKNIPNLAENPDSRGNLVIPLEGTNSRNQLTITYLLIRPTEGQNSFSTKLTRNWVKSRTVEGGHRGCGNSFTTKNLLPTGDTYDGEIDTGLISDIRENSIKSFNSAHVVGKADLVEFDVSLSKDSIPIIYHDLVVLYKNIPTPLAFVDYADMKPGTLVMNFFFRRRCCD